MQIRARLNSRGRESEEENETTRRPECHVRTAAGRSFRRSCDRDQPRFIGRKMNSTSSIQRASSNISKMDPRVHRISRNTIRDTRVSKFTNRSGTSKAPSGIKSGIKFIDLFYLPEDKSFGAPI
ncbi:hypothetical protein PUN28_001110 [Cardiocondyla obscurior]|uniref:Uncharacterized protein n=1 Tax=Cardiocondyla obscurior TaxID=286306 RepID=A0AAW2H316_9HYME